MARFVIGEWDIHDSDAVAAYQAGLTEHGKATLLAFWQEIATLAAK